MPGAHAELIRVSIAALVDGCDSVAAAELAGSESDNPFEIDAAIERLIRDLDIGPWLEADMTTLAMKKLAREVTEGRLDERDFTRWVHAQFGHGAEGDLVNRLAELDDEFGIAEYDDEFGNVKIGAEFELVRAAVQEAVKAVLSSPRGD